MFWSELAGLRATLQRRFRHCLGSDAGNMMQPSQDETLETRASLNQTSARGWGLRLLCAGLLLVLGVGVLWASAALFIDVPVPFLRLPLAAVALLGSLASVLFLRPIWRAWMVVSGIVLFTLAWWCCLEPSNDRDWQPDVSVLPWAELHGDKAVLHNIRDCVYRTETDYDVRHIDRTIDLDRIVSVDLYLVYWGSPLIAHTMVSFGFENGEYLCCSIEVRKERDEGYSAVRGFFRQFELTYIFATERDLVGLRTNYRKGEDVYLYRVNMTPQAARDLLREYLNRANQLKNNPEWYNALTSNCTTNIRLNSDAARGRSSPFDWRILANGKCDEMLYERHAFPSDLPFPEMRSRSLVNAKAQAVTDPQRFSELIREGLPTMRP